MVAYLGLGTQELPYEEIGNIIVEILLAWEKAQCYEEVTNHCQRIHFSFFLHLWQNAMKNCRIIILNQTKDMLI